MSKRAQFVTKTGVIAATVGSAVGLGNIWRFPYEAGTHGGGAFLLIYIACVVIVGIPVMMSEFVIGRSTHKNPKGAMKQLAAKAPFFNIIPYIGIIASLMILSFYSVVAGWITEYLYQSVADLFSDPSAQSYSDKFTEFITNPWRPVLWSVIFLLANFMVLARGIDKGIERVSNIMMPILFLILIALAVNSLTLPGASEGVNFLLNPDFSKINPQMVIGAMGQAFFSLSLGLTCMITYSSYFSDSTPLLRSAGVIAALDSLVALLAGLLIFPAVFTYGMTPEAGPKLVFETLPAIFAQMPGGNFLAILFFLLLFFASITSTVSMSEISISFFVEEWGMSRCGASGLNVGIAMTFGVLCALSFGALSDVTIFGKTIFDIFDYVSSNICLPIGGILITLFAGWFIDRRILNHQLNSNGALPHWLVVALTICMRWVAPAAILVIFLSCL